MPATGAAKCGGTIDFGFAFPKGYDPELSVYEVLKIQRRYLTRNLKLLVDDRAAEATQQEVIDWVAAPLVPVDKIDEIPATAFQCCCYTACVDPETMQETVLHRFAPDRLAELGDE